MEECHKMLTDSIDWANPEGDQDRIDISKPLPLSGPPGHITIQTQFFFNHDLDYLRYGSKGSGQALLISKMKAAYYLEFGLELLVPENMRINDVCTYDRSASYGISHWWFNRQKFYIDRHTTDSSHKVYINMEMVSSCSGRDKFVTACSYLTNTFKEIMKAQAYVSKLPFQDPERYEHVGPQDTRPQDGKRLQDDDQRLDLADDLKKAQDHISSLNTSHKTKTTTSKYKISSEESKTTS
ncbi:hypothetical protein Tco_0701686 [Tanacetum coccineum]